MIIAVKRIRNILRKHMLRACHCAAVYRTSMINTGITGETTKPISTISQGFAVTVRRIIRSTEPDSLRSSHSTGLWPGRARLETPDFPLLPLPLAGPAMLLTCASTGYSQQDVPAGSRPQTKSSCFTTRTIGCVRSASPNCTSALPPARVALSLIQTQSFQDPCVRCGRQHSEASS